MAADFDRFDLVVAMDRSNERRLLALAPERARPKVRLLRSFAPAMAAGTDADLDVPDPWGHGESVYAEMFDLVEVACEGLLEDLTAERP